jgi:hypothetical protein
MRLNRLGLAETTYLSNSLLDWCGSCKTAQSRLAVHLLSVLYQTFGRTVEANKQSGFCEAIEFLFHDDVALT